MRCAPQNGGFAGGGLTDTEIERYSRQMILTGWGAAEQLRLRGLTVAVERRFLSAALYLAAAGVGKIVVVDSSPAAAADPLFEYLAAFDPSTEVSSRDGWAALAGLDCGELAVIGPSAVDGTRDVAASLSVGISNTVVHGEEQLEGTPGMISLECRAREPHPGSLPVTVRLEPPSGIDPCLYAGTAAASALLSLIVSRPERNDISDRAG